MFLTSGQFGKRSLARFSASLALFFACSFQSQAQQNLFENVIEADVTAPYHDAVGRAIHKNRDGSIVSISSVAVFVNRTTNGVVIGRGHIGFNDILKEVLLRL